MYEPRTADLKARCDDGIAVSTERSVVLLYPSFVTLATPANHLQPSQRLTRTYTVTPSQADPIPLGRVRQLPRPWTSSFRNSRKIQNRTNELISWARREGLLPGEHSRPDRDWAARCGWARLSSAELEITPAPRLPGYYEDQREHHQLLCVTSLTAQGNAAWGSVFEGGCVAEPLTRVGTRRIPAIRFLAVCRVVQATGIDPEQHPPGRVCRDPGAPTSETPRRRPVQLVAGAKPRRGEAAILADI